jgi:hypothetical protein
MKMIRVFATIIALLTFGFPGYSQGIPRRGIAMKSSSSHRPTRSVKRSSPSKRLDQLIQKNCDGDLSEIELLAINSSELQGMMEQEQISDRQLKIESSSHQEVVANLAEACAGKIHKSARVFVEASLIEAKLLKYYSKKTKI